ncbi:MAG TPA: hypothetical protein VGQ81_04225 [Acidobacteriota bacterium]|nr:hypothetical protein [Acidobacteriota bacterium]
MTIFGKSLSEYIRFQKGFLLLIVAVAVARLALSLAGVPNATAKWVSVTAMLLIGLLYYSVRVYTSGFGSYRQLLPIIWFQSFTAHLIIAAAIVLGIVTQHDNIFTAPEYSGGGDGKTWFHAGAHLVLGTTVGPLIGWLVGCLIMFITKKVKREKPAMA